MTGVAINADKMKVNFTRNVVELGLLGVLLLSKLSFPFWMSIIVLSFW